MNVAKGVGLSLTLSGILPSPPQFFQSTTKSSIPKPKFYPKSSSDSNNATTEVRICINRTCRRQGSMDVFQILLGIAPPTVTVNSSGCLGRCGAGPNLVILPGPNFVAHCGTPARAADVMAHVCCGGDSVWGKRSLEALALRKKAEDEMRKGNFSQAELLLTQAIDLKPFGGIHIIYKDRSEARLAKSKIAEALEDLKEALTLAPKYPELAANILSIPITTAVSESTFGAGSKVIDPYRASLKHETVQILLCGADWIRDTNGLKAKSEAWICQGDVFMATEQFDAAENSYSMALELDPSIRRSKSFKARILKLQEKVAVQNSS